MAKRNKGTRVFILVIVGAFLLSSLSLSVLVIWELAKGGSKPSDSQTADIQQQLQDQLDQQNKETEVQKQPLNGYNSDQFDKASVTKLEVETLVQGSGKEASANSTVKANYFGWTSDGKIFDSSNNNGSQEPIEFPLNGVIQGWTQGLTGVKEGSTVKLTIPSDLAYGKTGSPPVIGPDEPLVFIVELTQVK